jgi:hypothetical protein
VIRVESTTSEMKKSSHQLQAPSSSGGGWSRLIEDGCRDTQSKPQCWQ